jgi:hypothetical protein
MPLPHGKGFYIWKVPNCEGGDPEKIALTAHQVGLTHVLVKIANGIYDYNYDVALKKDLVAPLSNALAKYNIKTWGWHYVYGDLPKKEAEAAIRQIRKIPLEGYVIDAEAEYKGKYTACRIFMSELRNAFPSFSMALSSYRYPKYHNDLPWADFLSKCDLNMPQVYWEQLRNPGDQLEKCLNEFKTFVSPFRPLVPTGSAYGANNWYPKPAEITEFMNKAVSLGLSGVNFWSWDYCRRSLPILWDTIASFEWPGTESPAKDIVEELVEAINSKNISSILGFYQPDAVHIDAKETIQGQSSLAAWFSELISFDLKDKTIQILEWSKKDPTRQFTWIAKSADGNFVEGSDTLGLLDNKIIYHFSSFTKK